MFEIIAGVALGNFISITVFTLVNSYLDKKASAKRKAELDALFDRIDLDMPVPVKKTVKRAKKKD
jgi:hypothetical protein